MHPLKIFVCLFVLGFNVPLNNFHVSTERFLPGMCLAQGHNTLQPVGIKLRTSLFSVQCETAATPP